MADMSSANRRSQRQIPKLLEQSPERKRAREGLDDAGRGRGASGERVVAVENVRTIAASTERLTFGDGWRGK